MSWTLSFSRFLAWLAAALMVLLALAISGCGASERNAPRAVGGVIDLRGWDPARDGVVALDGKWDLLWNTFDSPSESTAEPLGESARRSVPIDVPGDWNSVQVGGAPAGAQGYATYRLTVLCQANQTRALALSMPMQHSALRLWVNGRAVAQQGSPGATPALAQAAPEQQIAHLDNASCPLRIVAHVSNFELRRGGLVRSIGIGSPQRVHGQRDLGLVRDLFVLGCLTLMGLVPMLFFFFRRGDRSPVYFGLFCLSFAMYVGMGGERILQSVLAPLGFTLYLKLVLVSLFLNSTLFTLFLRAQYPRVVTAWGVRWVAGWGFGSIGVLLALPVSLFSFVVPVLQVGSVLVGVYLVASLVRAVRAGSFSAGVLLAGLAVLIASIVHDSLNIAHLRSQGLAPWGMMIFALAPGFLLARRFVRALSAEELRALEQRERANLLVRATRAGTLDWDAVRGGLKFSDRYREMLGYPVNIAGEPSIGADGLPQFYDMVHAEDRERVRNLFVAQLRQREVRSAVRPFAALEYRLLCADGQSLWVHAEGIGLCGADGRTLRFICSFIDISERKRTEIELTNRVKFTNDLVDSLPLALALRDAEGRYLVVNRTWEQYIGLSRESVIGASLSGVADATAESALVLDREALALGPGAVARPHEYDYQGRRFLQTRTVMADAEGARIGVLVATLDITAKYKAELALATEQERLRLLVRSTRAGFGDWDAEADRVTYTGRFKEMLGYPPDTDTSAWPSIFEMMHPDDKERARAEFRRMIQRRAGPAEAQPGAAMSYRLRRTDGSYVWIHAEGISLVDAQGRTRRFITSYLDVTAFREQEEALRHSRDEIAERMRLIDDQQRRLDLVVRGARVGIVDWDGATHATYYSPRFREIRGYAPDADTADWPDYFRVMIHPDDRERITSRWVPFIKGKGPEGPQGSFYSPEEYRLSRADGSHVWVQVSGMAVRDERGFVVRWIAAVIDISERHRQQEELRASRDQIAAQAGQLELQNETLKDNVRLREEVERIGRHDLKTPLNSIIAVPRLLREERTLSADEDALLGVVERAGYRILSMVNLSLDLYKMENGSYIFRPDVVDLADLLDKVLADLRSHAASKGVSLNVAVNAQTPQAWAEELLCYSLLANLVKNALEASPEGGEVSITIAAGQPPKDVLLTIHNQGEVPREIRGNFFQKYATAGKASGTGLGAYSARLMARVQDGDIQMQTSQAGGTTLSVHLRAAPSGTVPATARHAAERRSTQPLQLAGLSALRVLLVDDDEYNLLIVRRFLPTPPFTVGTAINGRMAIDAAQRHWPDVIFMDLDMPVMGGLEAVGLLRAHERQAQVARCLIIALSSHDDEATQQRCLDSGFDRYLTKPVSREAIHQVLRDCAVVYDAPDLPVAASGPLSTSGPDDTVYIDGDMVPLLEGFLATRRVLCAELCQALQANDRELARGLAHKLGGSLGLYGFHWAARRSLEIEANCSQPVPVLLEGLERSARELQTHLDHVHTRVTDAAKPGA